MGNFGCNGAEDRGDTHGFSSTYHGEAGTTVARRDMGDAQGGSSAGIGRNSVGDELHRETVGNRSTLGSVAANI